MFGVSSSSKWSNNLKAHGTVDCTGNYCCMLHCSKFLLSLISPHQIIVIQATDKVLLPAHSSIQFVSVVDNQICVTWFWIQITDLTKCTSVSHLLSELVNSTGNVRRTLNEFISRVQLPVPIHKGQTVLRHLVTGLNSLTVDCTLLPFAKTAFLCSFFACLCSRVTFTHSKMSLEETKTRSLFWS